MPEFDLRDKDLTGACFAHANLTGADLTGADLSQADMFGAQLAGANLTNTCLFEAELRGVRLGRTVFQDTMLRRAEGLDTCLHLFSSAVDDRTLDLNPDLPEPFLRGCGLPDWRIEGYFAHTAGSAHFSCFISYSHADETFAKRLHADLQASGVRCWLSSEDLKIGDRIRETVEEQIRTREKLVVVLSRASLASEWVEHEVTMALAEEQKRGSPVLHPLRLDNEIFDLSLHWAKQLADSRREGRLIADFRDWTNPEKYVSTLDRFIADLRRVA